MGCSESQFIVWWALYFLGDEQFFVRDEGRAEIERASGGSTKKRNQRRDEKLKITGAHSGYVTT